MSKKCKPTEKAIFERMQAYARLLRIRNAYLPDGVVPIEIFGIKHKLKREGIFTIKNLIEELQ